MFVVESVTDVYVYLCACACVRRATKEENRAEELMEQERLIDEYLQQNASSSSSNQNTTLQLDPVTEIPRNTYIYIYTGTLLFDSPRNFARNPSFSFCHWVKCSHTGTTLDV